MLTVEIPVVVWINVLPEPQMLAVVAPRVRHSMSKHASIYTSDRLFGKVPILLIKLTPSILILKLPHYLSQNFGVKFVKRFAVIQHSDDSRIFFTLTNFSLPNLTSVLKVGVTLSWHVF